MRRWALQRLGRRADRSRLRDRGLLPGAAVGLRGARAGSTLASGSTARRPTSAVAARRRLRRGPWRRELAATTWASASATGVEGLVFEHFERGGEHFVAKHEGRSAVLAYRLANLNGAALRALLSGVARTAAVCTVRRAGPPARACCRASRPRSLSTARPRRPPGEGLVVCSLEPWDEVWRRNQFLVRELLALDPNRRVLFVEPPFDRVLEARRPTGRRRRRGLSSGRGRWAHHPVRAGQGVAPGARRRSPTARCVVRCAPPPGRARPACARPCG